MNAHASRTDPRKLLLTCDMVFGSSAGPVGETAMLTKRKMLVLFFGLFLVPYVGTYCNLSRQDQAEARRLGINGFCYFPPENTAAWEFKHNTCAYFYWPLNTIDQCVGLGKSPAQLRFTNLGGGKK
jgi:hypothetical protein